MTRHDNVDAAALAGCNSSLLRSTQLAGGDVMPPQVSRGLWVWSCVRNRPPCNMPLGSRAALLCTQHHAMACAPQLQASHSSRALAIGPKDNKLYYTVSNLWQQCQQQRLLHLLLCWLRTGCVRAAEAQMLC